MKTKKIGKFAVVIAVALTAAFISSAPTEARAQKGAGAAALVGKPINTVQDVQALKAGDQVTMACPECKTITVTKIEEGKGAVKRNVNREQHQCPGCANIIKINGVGKAATQKVEHVCKNCGSDLAFCCALTKDGTTKGMEK